MGILAALVVAAMALSRAGKPWKPYFAMAGIAPGVGILVAAAVPLIGQIASMMLLNKFAEGSGLERLYSTGLAAHDFMKYPILGAGWHNVHCADLLFLILANTGLIGLITFGYFLLPVLRDLWVSARQGKPSAAILLSAVVLMVVLAEASGLTYSAGYIWLAFGLGVAGAIAARGELAIETSERVRASVPRISPTETAQGTC
jgi:hypothetical protein